MPDELKVNQSAIRLTSGFIIDLNVEAIVYYARPDLALGSGFGAAITTYILRIRWLLRFKAGRERQAPTGPPDTSSFRGIIYSWANIGMPWAMESTRQQIIFYLQFVIFHLAVAASIAMSFIIPYAPGLLKPVVGVRGLQGLYAAACLIGCYRLYRRLSHPVLRLISTPEISSL